MCSSDLAEQVGLGHVLKDLPGELPALVQFRPNRQDLFTGDFLGGFNNHLLGFIQKMIHSNLALLSYQRNRRAPQARPAPNVHNRTKSPERRRPPRQASSMAMGMLADDVLP